MENTGFFDAVYQVVRQIPRGKVATYGQIARILGRPHSSRAVGYALHANPQPGVIPCHRVVNRFGQMCTGFAFGGIEVQAAMLAQEGVAFDDEYSIDLSVYGWDAR